MKNLALKTQLEGLREIGLDRVNSAVAAVFGYVDQLEEETVYGAQADREHIAQFESNVTLLEQAKDQLKEENRLLRAELAAVYKAVQNPNAGPSPTPGYAGDPPGGSPGAV